MNPFTSYLMGMTGWTFTMFWRASVTPELGFAILLMYIGGITMMSVVYLGTVIGQKK